MKIPPLHEERQYAEKQWRAAHTIIWCKEQENGDLRKRIAELEKELKLVSRNLDKSEVDSLRSTLEILTNELEGKTMNDDKYVITVNGEDIEFDKDSFLGKCKELLDEQDKDITSLAEGVCKSFGVAIEDLK